MYALARDGMLHVVGLPSAKETYKPAPFVPAGARATDLLAVNDVLYTSTTGKCGGSADAVYAMDLASEAKPVVSYKTTGSPVGAVALTTGGTVVAVVTNGVVTLDPKTLAVKQSFTDSAATFATGPLVFTHGGKDVVAAGSKDGRILLFDTTLSAPIASVKVASDAGATFGADALAFFQQYSAPPPDASNAIGVTFTSRSRRCIQLAFLGAKKSTSCICLFSSSFTATIPLPRFRVVGSNRASPVPMNTRPSGSTAAPRRPHSPPPAGRKMLAFFVARSNE